MKLGCHVWIYVRVAKTGDSTGNDWVYFGFGRFLSFCFNGLKDPPRGAIIVSWISQRTSVGARSEYFFFFFCFYLHLATAHTLYFVSLIYLRIFWAALG